MSHHSNFKDKHISAQCIFKVVKLWHFGCSKALGFLQKRCSFWIYDDKNMQNNLDRNIWQNDWFYRWHRDVTTFIGTGGGSGMDTCETTHCMSPFWGFGDWNVCLLGCCGATIHATGPGGNISDDHRIWNGPPTGDGREGGFQDGGYFTMWLKCEIAKNLTLRAAKLLRKKELITITITCLKK